ncbi:MAG: L-threonine 3-dehydrogenase, partial [Cyanobacteria bacterium]|nr:L-threonine 3-dehydrogenase [Cyanobacteriota bacterium]
RKNLMCGVDVDGAFAEFIKAPEHCVYPLPQNLSPRYCAFIEPIAASLAVLKANFTSDQIGCIYGKNRIATLTHKILQAKGYENVTIHPEHDEILDNHYDYMIETIAKTPDITKMIDALKIGGLLVLKSRQINPVEITINSLVKKDLTLKAVHYGDFKEAIDLLASGKLDLSDLIGNIYALDDFKTAFTESQKNESKKCYLTL